MGGFVLKTLENWQWCQQLKAKLLGKGALWGSCVRRKHLIAPDAPVWPRPAGRGLISIASNRIEIHSGNLQILSCVRRRRWKAFSGRSHGWCDNRPTHSNVRLARYYARGGITVSPPTAIRAQTRARQSFLFFGPSGVRRSSRPNQLGSSCVIIHTAPFFYIILFLLLR